MTVAVWRIAADTAIYVADDMTGAGAKKTGGRWNTPGVPVLYSSVSIALAVIEAFVHLEQDDLPMNRYLVRIDIPDKVWDSADVLTAAMAGVGWDAEPSGIISKRAGDKWLKSRTAVLLRVPSVVVPLEENVLINPEHPDSAKLVVTKLQKWTYDQRMKK